MKIKRVGALSIRQCVILWVLPLLAGFAALAVGRFWVNPADIWHTLMNKLGASYSVAEQTATVIWNMRLPRVLLAALVGAGLSAAGCSFQSLFANPLATPDTLGVASASGFGAALALLLGFNLPLVQLTAFGMGLLSVVLTVLAGGKKSRSIHTVILAGIMTGSLFTALVSLVKFTADTESQLPAITYWLMGSLSSANYASLALGAPIILIGLIGLFLLRWRMNLLPLSEDEIRASGTPVLPLRAVTVVCATAVTAACISMCGQVGWVGLLIPHICRMRFGNNHIALLPASISLGAVFMILVDTVARSVSAAEIPVSILTAIIGAPFFIILMRKTGGWQL